MLGKFYMLFLITIFLPLIACQAPRGQVDPTIQPVPQLTDLSFKTLAIDVTAKLYDEGGDYYYTTYPTPTLLIATNAKEAHLVATLLNPDVTDLHLPHVDEVNFAKEFIVIAYYGQAPRGGFKITIEHIRQSANLIDVFVRTFEPEMGDALITYPIHIVKVDKTNLSSTGEFEFRLWKNNQIVVQYSHMVP